MTQIPIAAQMYTVRQAAAEDLRGALRRVAKLGYAGVELAGTFGMTATELSQTLNDLGLKSVSAHVPLTDLRQNLAWEIDYYLAVGVNFLICPWLPPEQRGNEADYRALGAELNRIGEVCRTRGLQLCYHHHDFELVQFNGKYALDILLAESDPTNLQLEADTYWLKFGGEDPATYIRRWPGRVPLIHLKDMTATQPPTFGEVGTGILDWSSIFAAANEVGAKWYLVEQDKCPGDPFESLKISLEKLQKLLS